MAIQNTLFFVEIMYNSNSNSNSKVDDIRIMHNSNNMCIGNRGNINEIRSIHIV